ncbi:hypothetical protein LCGC14_1812760 [marine sediment metagenome]|uniref:Uncharacterized protein n=1 Tax=marine sediment metagenome TaxID=412755 RepID=A0A0F9JKW5_9ZZZZ
MSDADSDMAREMKEVRKKRKPMNYTKVIEILKTKILPKITNQEEMEKQITDLANFIMKDVESEPSQNQGAIETAIRIIKESKTELATLKAELEEANKFNKERASPSVIKKVLGYDKLQKENAKLRELLDLVRLYEFYTT